MPFPKEVVTERQVIMSPTPTSWVSLHHFWGTGGRKNIEVCDAGVLGVQLVVDVQTLVDGRWKMWKRWRRWRGWWSRSALVQMPL